MKKVFFIIVLFLSVQEAEAENGIKITREPLSVVIWPSFKSIVVQEHVIKEDTVYSTFSMHVYTEVKVEDGYVMISETYDVLEQFDWNEANDYLIDLFKEDVKIRIKENE